MKKTYIADPIKMTASGVFAIVILVLIPEFFAQGSTVGGFLFLAIGLLFLGIAIFCSRLVTVGPEGISFSWFGVFGRKEYSWSEIGEVGVCGMRLFKPKSWKSTGMMYIYFSKEPMNEDERFAMVLKWPQKQYPYIAFSKKCWEHVQVEWGEKFVYYNVDKLKMSLK